MSSRKVHPDTCPCRSCRAWRRTGAAKILRAITRADRKEEKERQQWREEINAVILNDYDGYQPSNPDYLHAVIRRYRGEILEGWEWL